MNWLTIIWSMCAAACGMMMLMHLGIAAFDRRRGGNLLVAAMALGAVGVTMAELFLMKSAGIESGRLGMIVTHLFLFLLLVPIPWFVRAHFGCGTRWLAWAATGMWVLTLVLCFALPLGLPFSSIDSLVTDTTFWGEPFLRIEGARSPLALIPDIGVLLILAHTIDASVRLCRRGNPRRALLVGGSIVLFFVAAMAHVPLVDLGVLKMPTMIGPIFMPIVAALSAELISQVAAHLGIVEKTVKVHRARVFEKMGVHSVAELVPLCELAGVKPVDCE